MIGSGVRRHEGSSLGSLRARLQRLASKLVFLLLALLALHTVSGRARADEVRALSFNTRLEAPLLATGATAWILSEVLKSKLTPSHCRLCGVNALDGSIRDALHWSNAAPARHASDALLFGVVPLAAFSSAALMAVGNHTDGALSTDMLMLVESMVLTADLTQLSKYLFVRERPYAYAARSEHRDLLHRADDNLSFFSGHTSITFTLAAALGTTASLRGYKQAPLVWAIGMPLAALTGYLRIAADKHYFTDVLTGALIGTAVGVLVPWLHTRSVDSQMPSLSLGAPGTLSFSWVR
ncbi:MAG: hypothetical protein JWN48_1306 [Myxococcaceae bacterium]|nr:hypothetical protein [Myxococcaceae bacterium]